MAAASPKYPFIPKSTQLLLPGQYWSIPLKNQRFACGRVLQLKFDNGKRDSRLFLAGLMDWTGDTAPDADAITSRTVLDQGEAHVKTIAENGGLIRGHRPLELDDIEPGLFLDESPGPGCQLRRGLELLGPASAAQQASLPVFETWGYSVILELAEKHFGQSQVRQIRKRN